jgi:hypothetical protein
MPAALIGFPMELSTIAYEQSALRHHDCKKSGRAIFNHWGRLTLALPADSLARAHAETPPVKIAMLIGWMSE